MIAAFLSDVVSVFGVLIQIVQGPTGLLPPSLMLDPWARPVIDGGRMEVNISIQCGIPDGCRGREVFAFIVIEGMQDCIHPIVISVTHQGKRVGHATKDAVIDGVRVWRLFPVPNGPAQADVVVDFHRKCEQSASSFPPLFVGGPGFMPLGDGVDLIGREWSLP